MSSANSAYRETRCKAQQSSMMESYTSWAYVQVKNLQIHQLTLALIRHTHRNYNHYISALTDAPQHLLSCRTYTDIQCGDFVPQSTGPSRLQTYASDQSEGEIVADHPVTSLIFIPLGEGRVTVYIVDNIIFVCFIFKCFRVVVAYFEVSLHIF